MWLHGLEIVLTSGKIYWVLSICQTWPWMLSYISSLSLQKSLWSKYWLSLFYENARVKVPKRVNKVDLKSANLLLASEHLIKKAFCLLRWLKFCLSVEVVLISDIWEVTDAFWTIRWDYKMYDHQSYSMSIECRQEKQSSWYPFPKLLPILLSYQTSLCVCVRDIHIILSFNHQIFFDCPLWARSLA